MIDSIIQYACAVDWRKVRGAEDIEFEGLERRSKAPAGLLHNLGKAQAKNYRLDVACVPPLGRTFDPGVLTELQDDGAVELPRTHVGRPYPIAGSRWMESSEDLFPRWKGYQSHRCCSGLNKGELHASPTQAQNASEVLLIDLVQVSVHY